VGRIDRNNGGSGFFDFPSAPVQTKGPAMTDLPIPLHPPSVSPPPPGAVARWWIYQRERFPIFAHGVLIAAFSFSAVGYSALLRGAESAPWVSFLVAFVNSFLAFLQLRIADEFKDFEEDRRYRPYRPVPRGLIRLRELGALWVMTGVVQLGLALWLEWRLLLPLAATWTYLALMSKEFFAERWLRARPLMYLWTHMLIMPLIDFYGTACDWLPLQSTPPPGLGAFLAVSFFNGIVIELGRKLRAPADEETGVNTYTALWGRPVAVGAWGAALGATFAAAFCAAGDIHFLAPVVVLLTALLMAAGLASARFLREPTSAHAKWFERLSGVWTLALYLSLGAVPMLLRAAGWK
jgi:hypothetical protein